MTMPPPTRPLGRAETGARVWRGLVAVCLMAGITACGPATLPPGDSIADVDEAQNRAIHDFNLSLDRALVGPGAEAYGDTIPEPVRDAVGNFAANLSQPGYVVNNLLQFRLGDAFQNTLRFAINTTLGLGGILDPATSMGLPAETTDFGETLHVYGVGEGDYMVLPVLGPSTTRDTLGRMVDTAMNPLRHIVEAPESRYLTATQVAAGLGARDDMAATFDDLLYGSEDSYLQLRSLYLQNRRFQLRGDDVDGYIDPYGGGYAADGGGAPTDDPYFDPYSDPYFDPYAE